LKQIFLTHALPTGKNCVVILEVDDTQTICWSADAAFAAHKDKHSIQAEFIAINDVISQILWSKKFN